MARGHRRLAAIMFTDMVGYTALTQADEPLALAVLERHHRLLKPIFRKYRGKAIKTMGDSFLVEFESALDATHCALEIQRFLHEYNQSSSDGWKIRLRIGIHLGDVIHQQHDVLGDAVNIASRIEPLAEPEGICLSEQVFDQVKNKLPYPLIKLGPRDLKNVRSAIDVYKITQPWGGHGDVPEPSHPGAPQRLAVLPFTNISPDPKDEYFADGLTEELITLLSQLHELRVIARTSVSQYKSTSKSIADIGSELGVTSVLEGSVRKAGDRLRITVQLIEVGSQEHTWADTYDRKLDDVFAVQTEVAKRIAKVLKIKTKKAEVERLEERPTAQPESYLAYLRGRTILSSGRTEAALREAKKQFERAISLDSRNARAHSGLADVTLMLGWYHYGGSRAEWDKACRTHAARAIELDPGAAEAHCSLAAILWDDFDWPAAEKEFQRALSLNPSYSLAHRWFASFLEDEARTDEALREISLAEESDPQSTTNLSHHAVLLIWLRRLKEAKVKIERLRELDRVGHAYHSTLSLYHFARSDYPNAIREIDRAEELRAEGWGPIFHAWFRALQGEQGEARKLLRELEGKPAKVAPPEWLAAGYVLLGDLDACFRILEQALENHELPLQTLRNEPTLEPMRTDPRFARLLRRMNLA